MFLLKIIGFVLKLIAKVILLPVMLLFFMVKLVVNLLYHIGAAGYFLCALVLVYGIVTAIMGHAWNSLICCGILSVIGTAAIFAAAFVVIAMEAIMEGMVNFMFS